MDNGCICTISCRLENFQMFIEEKLPQKSTTFAKTLGFHYMQFMPYMGERQVGE